MANFDLNKYIPVHSCITSFHEKYAEGRILPEVVSLPKTADLCASRQVPFAAAMMLNQVQPVMHSRYASRDK